MAGGSQNLGARLDVSTWSDLLSRDALELITVSVAEMAGFEVAAVSVVRDDMIFSVAVSGPADVREAMIGMQTPIELIEGEIDHADDWGRFKFVPHERLEVDVEVWGWVPDLVPREEDNAWHALDLLIAPLYDVHGAMIGLLSIDLPLSGLRPAPTQRLLLERYAVHAERALRIALEREALSQRVRLADAAREVVRFATSQPDFERVLDDCRPALLEGFNADNLSIRTYAHDDSPEAGTPTAAPPSDEVRAVVQRVSTLLWREQRVGFFARDHYDPHVITVQQHDELAEAMESVGWGMTMLVPLGAGSTCLGHLILARTDPDQTWSADEERVALDVARDLGQAVFNSRTLARERRLVRDLRRLDLYKTQLLSTVSHELKNPLAAISGHLEMLQQIDAIPADGQFSLAAIERGARRLNRLVDNLLVLAEAGDPESPVKSVPLDLRPLLHDALDLSRVAAERRELTISVNVPEQPVVGCCDVEDLDRILTNLLSNAVKYTPVGGTITISTVAHASEVELSVADEGIGISQQDQGQLFTEFFRSSNPQALAQPGTGLGLAICGRIVARHGGRIEVDSTLGLGSTFRVFLPSPAA